MIPTVLCSDGSLTYVLVNNKCNSLTLASQSKYFVTTTVSKISKQFVITYNHKFTICNSSITTQNPFSICGCQGQ